MTIETTTNPLAGIPVPLREDLGSTRSLSATTLREYRACQRRYFYRKVARYVPLVTAATLYFGRALHQALEAWWLAWKNADGTRALELALFARRFEDAHDQVRLEEVVRGYDLRWREWASRQIVLDVEASFARRLINPASGRPSQTWHLAGRLDLLLLLEDGRTAVVEHKSSSEDLSPDGEYIQKLRLDGQVSQYWEGGEARGHRIDEVLYDICRKPRLQPLKATPEASRKYTKAGALYAGQRAEDETPEEFQARLREAIEENLEASYVHVPLTRTAEDRREYLTDVWLYAGLIRDTERTGHAPRNPDACHVYGQACDYWPVCTGQCPITDETKYRRLPERGPAFRQAHGDAPAAPVVPGTCSHRFVDGACELCGEVVPGAPATTPAPATEAC